jgi:hypothetical protein
VATLVSRRLGEEDGPGELLAALRPAVEARDELRGRVDSVLALLRQVQCEAETGIGLIKGLSANRLYPDPSLRDFGDFDVFVNGAGDAWRCALLLLGLGFDFDPAEAPWFKRDERGVIYGQVRLGRPDDGVWIDFHFGRYSVRNCASLEASAPAGVDPVPHEQNIAMLVANAAGDCFTTVKDLNDLYLAIASEQIDWDEVRRLIRSVRLDGYFNGMLRHLDRLYDLDELRPTVRSLRFRRSYEPPPSLAQGAWTQRWLATTAHTWQVAAGSSLRQRLAITREAARYYRQRLQLEIVDSGASPRALDPSSLTAWECVRVLPRDTLPETPRESPADLGGKRPGWQIAEGVEVVSVGDYDFLLAGDRTLIPTVYGRIPRIHLAPPPRLRERE